MSQPPKQPGRSKYLQSPWLESILMGSAIVVSYICLTVLAMASGEPMPGEMATTNIVLILFAFFLLSTAIAVVGVIAGIGGGVIFTPIMLAFTDVHSLVVRGTGLIVAMFSGPLSTGVFMRKGLVNYRLSLVMTLSQGLGALVGATFAILAVARTGVAGEGILRMALGLILVALAVFFIAGGKKLENPEISRVDKFTRWLKLGGKYYEASEGQIRDYEVTRAPLGIVLLFLIGILGGFFGMGGGWAITPALNIGMGMPLRLAAANSNVILSLGSGISIWPYVFAGGVIPLFVLPWMCGQAVGGLIGAYVLAKIKVAVVRIILIGIMIFTGFTLVTRGLEMVGFIGPIPAIVQVLVFVLTMGGALLTIFFKHGKRGEPNA
ncbi:MAG: sulfite exporter TauE/SafE family protein [Oscillospiraceae bacterium]|nr:sulfite exporter TauE/SafE family protein [Oscillospiraceae bacterium]